MDMLEKIRRLIELSAGEFERIDMAMIAHLDGTRCMLKAWGAREALQQAGLFHRAYTQRLVKDRQFISQNQRRLIAEVVGAESESIIYHYCACDRERFFNSLLQQDAPQYVDRFTQVQCHITPQLLNDLCELFVATELEFASDQRARHSLRDASIRRFLTQLSPYLSRGANNKVRQLLA